MFFFDILYRIIIGPLELFFEVIYVLANRVIGNIGLSIIVLSLVMNFLVLPLYKRADAMQEEQRDTEKRLKKWVTHIKKTFKGDERFMMLQTYYRQNNYKPTSILKGSVSLLLEIPFFIAAYNFLSHAGVFNGVQFGPFADLGSPDGLIKIGSLSINLLPILMTVINIVSSMIYTKGLPTSSKVQLYGMAGIFLILLYNSPAALVFYWTLNNLFSLVKNIFYKLKNPKFVLSLFSSAIGLVLLFYILFIHQFDTTKKNLFVIGLIVILEIPICLYILNKFHKIKKINLSSDITKNDKWIFNLSLIVLTLLIGFLIPSTVIKSSPEEFINTSSMINPLYYVIGSLLYSIGAFLIWVNLFYRLSNCLGKKVLTFLTSVISIICLVNYLFFSTNKGTLNSNLVFDNILNYSNMEILFNLLVSLLIIVLFIIIFKKFSKILPSVFGCISIVLFSMSFINCVGLSKTAKAKIDNIIAKGANTPSIPLSKDGKNVMVFMLDRAINSYIPYIFNEKPELAKQFEGFTYYPNTVSYGPNTKIGTPALYGGYEYTPHMMNARSDESLESKQNEALKVMPVIFDSEGYETTVCDPSYAGYNWIPDLSIYDEYPNIHSFITMGNMKEFSNSNIKNTDNMDTIFFLFSLYRVAPCLIQETLYDGGCYNQIDFMGQVCKSNYEATGLYHLFVESYNVLHNLDDITKLSSNEKGTFLMISNDTTHSPCLLQEPQYEPSFVVDNTSYETVHANRFNLNGRIIAYDDLNQITHYQINMAAMLQLGNYFDYLRENDLYNNTRIILVSDHGRDLHQVKDMILNIDQNYELDLMRFNPLLMVKDFNSASYKVDDSFMTHADVPSLAFKDLIEKPINPFTQGLINSQAKDGDVYILDTEDWDVTKNSGNTFLPGEWYSVKNNIFDVSNWHLINK